MNICVTPDDSLSSMSETDTTSNLILIMKSGILLFTALSLFAGSFFHSPTRFAPWNMGKIQSWLLRIYYYDLGMGLLGHSFTAVQTYERWGCSFPDIF